MNVRLVQPFPADLSVAAVERHKSILIQQAHYLRSIGVLAEYRVASAGASFWELWLDKRDGGLRHEERILSALALAEDSGDWQEVERVLEVCKGSRALSHKRDVRESGRKLGAALREQRERRDAIAAAYSAVTSVDGGEFRFALSMALELANSGPAKMAQWFVGRLLTRAGDPGAVDHFRNAASCEPTNRAYIVSWADAVARLSVADAVSVLRSSAVVVGADDFWIQTYLASHLWKRWQAGELDAPPLSEANAALASTLNAPPHPANGIVVSLAYLIAAYSRQESGDVEGAVVLLREAVALSPGDAYLRTALGIGLYKAGDDREATRELEIALRAAGLHRIWAEATLGVVCLRRREFVAARRRFDRAIESGLSKDRGGNLYNSLAVALWKEGEHAESISVLNHAFDLSPGNAAIRGNLQILRIAEPSLPAPTHRPDLGTEGTPQRQPVEVPFELLFSAFRTEQLAQQRAPA